MTEKEIKVIRNRIGWKVKKYLDDPDDLESYLITQAILLERRWNGSGDRMGWIIGNLNRRVIDYLRKYGKYTQANIQKPIFVELNLMSPDIKKAHSTWLYKGHEILFWRRARKILSLNQWELIKGKFIDKESNAQLARSYGWSEAYISITLKIALGKLKEKL